MKRKTTRYVAVLEGEGPGTSRPVIATSDQATVAAVLQLIQERLGKDVEAPPAGVEGDGNGRAES